VEVRDSNNGSEKKTGLRSGAKLGNLPRSKNGKAGGMRVPRRLRERRKLKYSSQTDSSKVESKTLMKKGVRGNAHGEIRRVSKKTTILETSGPTEIGDLSRQKDEEENLSGLEKGWEIETNLVWQMQVRDAGKGLDQDPAIKRGSVAETGRGRFPSEKLTSQRKFPTIKKRSFSRGAKKRKSRSALRDPARRVPKRKIRLRKQRLEDSRYCLHLQCRGHKNGKMADLP